MTALPAARVCNSSQLLNACSTNPGITAQRGARTRIWGPVGFCLHTEWLSLIVTLLHPRHPPTHDHVLTRWAMNQRPRSLPLQGGGDSQSTQPGSQPRQPHVRLRVLKPRAAWLHVTDRHPSNASHNSKQTVYDPNSHKICCTAWLIS